MRFLEEYRNERAVQHMVEMIHRTVSRPWHIMEVCGGQTHTLIQSGLDQLLPAELTLIHGPGCPVCVTPVELIDTAIALARHPRVILTAFGDMLRVPGSTSDLLRVRAEGGDVRMVYSPLDALNLAHREPEREVVFFAVGFETTAPATAMAVWQAKHLGMTNFSLICAHVLVPPAMVAILSSPHTRVQGFLAAGHVCTVMGYHQYEPLAATYRIPIVVTGFEPLDLLQGIYLVVRALEAGRWGVENQYRRVVRREGNQRAQEMLQNVFAVCDRMWRGIGIIPSSGYQLRGEFASFDAVRRFGLVPADVPEPSRCIAGEVLQGLKKPHQCGAFGSDCTPEHPLGAPMVSSEGACAAYYHYHRHHY